MNEKEHIVKFISHLNDILREYYRSGEREKLSKCDVDNPEFKDLLNKLEHSNYVMSARNHSVETYLANGGKWSEELISCY